MKATSANDVSAMYQRRISDVKNWSKFSKSTTNLRRHCDVAPTLQFRRNLFVIFDQSVTLQFRRNLFIIFDQIATLQFHQNLLVIFDQSGRSNFVFSSKFICNFRPTCDTAATSQLCRNLFIIFDKSVTS